MRSQFRCVFFFLVHRNEAVAGANTRLNSIKVQYIETYIKIYINTMMIYPGGIFFPKEMNKREVANFRNVTKINPIDSTLRFKLAELSNDVDSQH